MIWSIAWRNVWRNRSRSVVIMLAMMMGLTGGIFYNAFMMGMNDQRNRAAISNELSDFQIHHPEYLMNQEIRFVIHNPDSLCGKIASLDNLKGVSYRTKNSAMIKTATTAAGTMVNGIDPDSEKKVTNIYQNVVEGGYFDGSRRMPMLLSRKMAEKLHAKLGSKVVLSMANEKGSIVEAAFKVTGIYFTHNDLYDEANVFVVRSDLDKLLEFDGNSTSEIAVRLFKTSEIENFRKQLNLVLSRELETKKMVLQSWDELDPTLRVIDEYTIFFSYIFMGIILFALAFGIVNTMMMAVLERTREIGMLMANGMQRGNIFKMILYETLFLSITGGAAGIVVSLALVTWFSHSGIDLSIFGKGINSIGYNSVVYLYAPPELYPIVALMVTVTAMIASIYPARKALKMNPVEALHYNG
ncbi:MAG: FtsX-like permease family protein [Prolixibacteraceae bacterium]|nr:FtsX-like permease family protein [Prolixibacteraceae bacterium]